MKPLKIVIISKNSYPALGPRAHRTTELAIELAKRGHKVTVYAMLGRFDYSNFSQKTNITFKNLGVSKLGVTDNEGFYNKALWAKGLRRLFSKYAEVPNAELMPMVNKALKNEGNIDYLITIAQPHTIHWSAANYVNSNPNKIKFWVADCGDPYMKNPYHKHPNYFERFEKNWGNKCNFITVPIASAKKAYYQEFEKKIKVIPQGFRFDNLKLANYKPNAIPTFAYAGKVYIGLRDPSNFLEYLCGLNIDFKFIVYTKNENVFAPFKEKLGDKLIINGYLPRKELLRELSKMDFLLNIKNISQIQQPSKLIDYALTNRPILEISSLFDEEKEFQQFIEGNYENQVELKNINSYNITNVTNEFLSLYDENVTIDK